MDLTWNECRSDLLKTAINNNQGIGQGAASTFIPLSEHVGVKLFPSVELRDAALARQRTSKGHFVAPEAGAAFQLDDAFDHEPLLFYSGIGAKGFRRYGYVTERADTSRRPKREEIDAFVTKMRGIPELNAPADFEDNDENYGYIGGQLVFLDFDDGTWSSEDDY